MADGLYGVYGNRHHLEKRRRLGIELQRFYEDTLGGRSAPGGGVAASTDLMGMRVTGRLSLAACCQCVVSWLGELDQADVAENLKLLAYFWSDVPIIRVRGLHLWLEPVEFLQ